MSAFQTASATLRFFGDSLDPDSITKRLGCSPSNSARIGEEIVGKKTGQRLSAKTGRWLLSVPDTEPANLDMQIQDLLAQVTSDLHVWRELTSQYSADLYCGLFMASSNDGVSLSASTLHALGSRGLEICLDVYDPSEN
jgi:hypothetical protein